MENNGVKVFKKVLICMCLGLMFGVFAGLGFLVVQKTTGFVADKDQTAVNVANKDDSNDGSILGEIVNSITDDSDKPVESIHTNTSSPTQQATIITGPTDVSRVVEVAMPAMVSISKEYNYEDMYSFYFGGSYSQVAHASGSGIIIAETENEYLIVSNNHVVEDPVSLEVTFVDGSTASAYIKGCDADMDVAVIAVQKEDVSDETKGEIRLAVMGDSTNLKLGEPVVAIGNALGYGQSVTTGIISALDRTLESDDGEFNPDNKFIQTDAAINPGNSGGALLNLAGELIGINSAKIGSSSVEGMGYAIPISAVTDIISELMEHQTRIPIGDGEMGFMGIELQEVTESLANRFGMPVGIYVVKAEGPALAAGLQTGDIITKFDGEKIKSYDDLQNVLKYYAAGRTVTITFQRQENGGYYEHQSELTLGTRPENVK